MNVRKILKISSVIIMILMLVWSMGLYLLITESGASIPNNYKKEIKGVRTDFTWGCDSSLTNQVEGLFCNEFPELANLDSNSEYSEQEKEITRAIQIYNSKIGHLYYNLNTVYWVLLVLTIVFCINLIYDLKSRK